MKPILEYDEDSRTGMRWDSRCIILQIRSTISQDVGGHVLEFKVEEAVASVDYTSEFLMILPGENSDFYKIDLTQDKQEELEEVEK